jgi:hypothetical protein
MKGMKNFKIKVQNIQAKQNCLYLKEIKYIFPLKFVEIIRLMKKKRKIHNRMSEIPNVHV